MDTLKNAVLGKTERFFCSSLALSTYQAMRICVHVYVCVCAYVRVCVCIRACVSFSAHDCNFNLNAQRREGGTESGEGREREREAIEIIAVYY